MWHPVGRELSRLCYTSVGSGLGQGCPCNTSSYSVVSNFRISVRFAVDKCSPITSSLCLGGQTHEAYSSSFVRVSVIQSFCPQNSTLAEN